MLPLTFGMKVWTKVMIINPSITNGTLVYNSSTPVTITTDVTIDNLTPQNWFHKNRRYAEFKGGV